MTKEILVRHRDNQGGVSSHANTVLWQKPILVNSNATGTQKKFDKIMAVRNCYALCCATSMYYIVSGKNTRECAHCAVHS